MVHPDRYSRHAAMVELMRSAYNSPVSLVAAAVQLADRLTEITNDDALWESLSRGAPYDERTRQSEFALLAIVDWETLLEHTGYTPPPQANEVGDQLIDDLTAAYENGASEAWTQIHARVAWLSEQLRTDHDAPAPTEDRPWWSRLRTKVARAWNIVRQIDRREVVIGALETFAEGGLPLLITGLTIDAGITLGIAVGVATVFGVVKELRRVSAELETAEPAAQIDGIVYDGALAPAAMGRTYLPMFRVVEPYLHQNAADHLGSLAADESYQRLIAQARQYLAGVGATLAGAWSILTLAGGPAAEAQLDQVTAALRDTEQTFFQLVDAVNSANADAARVALTHGRHAARLLESEVTQLRQGLEHAGLATHRPDNTLGL